MKKLLSILIMLTTLSMTGLSYAEQAVIAFDTDYKGSAHEAITVSSTALGVSAETVKAGGVFITVEDANIRFCFDGTVATSTTCHVAYDGDSILLRNKASASALSMIRDDSTDATVRVTYLDY